MPTDNMSELLIMIGNLRDDLSEVRDRARRTETRLTRYLEQQGFNTKVTRPRFDPSTRTVHLPSPDCSWKETLDAIPPLMRQRPVTVNVMVGQDLIATINLPTY